MFHGLQPFVRHVNHDGLKFLRLTSSSLPSICFASYNHGKEYAQHGHECGGTASLYAAVSSAEIGHHLGQAGRSGSSDVLLWHQQPAYSFSLLAASEAAWIPLLLWLGVTDITSVNRVSSFLASVVLSRTSLLELKCAFQLPQALLGSRKLFVDLLLLFLANSPTEALKSSCVISSIDPWKNHWVLQLACNECNVCVVERVLHSLYFVPMLLVFHASESVQILRSECTANAFFLCLRFSFYHIKCFLRSAVR